MALDTVELRAEHIDLRGWGVGRCGELEVSVPGLHGGEVAEVEIVHRSAHHPRAVGRVRRLTLADPGRRDAACPRSEARGGGCGGCPLMDLEEASQRRQKQRMLAALGLTVGEVVADPDRELGYRFSAKRVVFSDRAGKLRLGSWRPGTHEGADMGGCLVDHPLLADALDEVAREASDLGLEPYDEAQGEGDLRYAWAKTDGERVLLTLITASERSRAAELAERLRLPASVAWSVQAGRGNAIRGGAPVILRGPERLRIEIEGVRVPIGPLGFLQPNPRLIARAYRDLLSDPEGRPLGGDRAWDLYAGAGVTTALLRARFSEVRPCESYAESARALGVEPSSVEGFLAAQPAPPDLIVANPPRKGLGAAVRAQLARLRAPRLALMSCGPKGLATDLEALEAAGYRLQSLRAYDTLPQTPHVELVAKLTVPSGEGGSSRLRAKPSGG